MPGGLFPVALVVAAVLIVALLAIAAAILTGRGAVSQSRQSDGDWYREARGLAAELQETIDGLPEPVERDRMQRALLPLSSRFEGHAREAPPGVDAQLVHRTFELGRRARTLAMEFTHTGAARRGVFLEDELDAIGETAAALEADIAAATA